MNKTIEISLGFSDVNDIVSSANAKSANRWQLPTAARAGGFALSQLEALASFAPIGIFQCDADGRCIYVNEAWQGMSGLTAAECLGHGWFQCVHRDDLGRLTSTWHEAVKAKTDIHAEFRAVRRESEIRYLRAHARFLRTEETGLESYVGCIEDVTDRITAESEKAKLAAAVVTDALTGLPNRTFMIQRLRDAVLNSAMRGDEFALMFMDFDRFKTVNDSWGHDVGDELLRQIADRIESELAMIESGSGNRIQCTAARFGGDEFVLLVVGVSGSEEAQSIAERLKLRLSEPHLLGPHQHYTTASIGIALGPRLYNRAEDILRDADTAMYEAKHSGRDRCVVFDSKMHAIVLRRMQIETELHTAISSSQFSLHYQPIVSLQTGEIAGVEGLVRWQHPTLGCIGPNEFIPIAQESNLILKLANWMLRQACHQMAQWTRTLGLLAPAFVSVNLARKQFADPRLLEQITHAIRDAGIAPGQLQLEVTEDAFALDIDDAVRTMQRIRDLGVRLAIDDFGSGTSSYVALHHFPVNVLKIDRCLIEHIEKSNGEAAMLHGLVVMARNLGIKLVAEGIEMANQAQALQELGCEYMQGFFFARPMPTDALEQFLRDTPGMTWNAMGAMAFANNWSNRMAHHEPFPIEE